MTRVCRDCQTEKSVEDFPRRSNGYLERSCKACHAKRRRERWHNNHQANLIKQRNYKHDNRATTRPYVWNYLLTHPCIDCGESDPIVLEFDHIDSTTKQFIVSVGVCQGYKLETVKAEMAKCVVRCANCHRRKTAKQLGYWTPN